MDIETTTERVNHVPSVHLLDALRATTRQDDGAPAAGTLLLHVIEPRRLVGVP
jgi:hypothetical protein